LSEFETASEAGLVIRRKADWLPAKSILRRLQTQIHTGQTPFKKLPDADLRL